MKARTDIRIPLVCWLACTLLWISQARSQAQDEFSQAWRWAQFTVESGLPSDQVHQVYESHDSTVWAGTALGIAWYDGFQWITVDSTAGLPSNTSASVIGEIGDSLVVSTGSQYFTGTRHGFRVLGIEPPKSSAVIEGTKLVYVREASLYQYEGGSESLFQPNLQLTRGRTLDVISTKSGALWLNLIDGLYKWENGRFQSKIPSGPKATGKSVIVENQEGSGVCALVFPFEKRGLWEWIKGSSPIHNRTENADNIITMDIGNDNEVLVVYPSDEVRIRENGVWVPVSFHHSQLRDILTVAFRKNGDLWVGTQHGLFLYRRSWSRWSYWNHPPPDMRNSVNEILRAHNGDIWIGTSDGIEIHRASGNVDRIPEINGVPLYVVTGLAEDDNGNIWISSGASFFGAYRWDGAQWRHFTVSDDSGGIRFHKIRVDRRGRVWFLGIGKFFPPLVDKQPGAFVLEHDTFHRWGEPEGLLSGRVYSFGDSPDGTLWFGTYTGLSRWKNGVWTHWTTKNGLHPGRVFTIAVDHNGQPWFGNYSDQSGLATIDEHDSIQYFSTADGLVSDKVWDLRFDGEGTLWVATAGGLSSYAHGRWSTYNESSGLQHVSLWPVLPLKNEVYVGTTGKGVAILHRNARTTPNPHIILDKPLTEGKNVILRWKAFAYWGELTPEEIFTRMRINAGAWTPWLRRNEVLLPDQDHGEYSYQVQAKNVFGGFSNEGVQGSFVVPLPLHLRPVFLFPVGALALLVIVLGIVMLMRKRRHDLAIRKSEAKFRAVAEMTLSAIFIYQDERLLFLNPGAEKLTGYTQDELYKMKLWEMIHPEHRALVHEWEMKRHGDTTVPHRAEFKIVTKQGKERWVNFTWGWIKFQDSPATLASAFDITEQKLAEEKLRSLASELSSTEERERRRLATYLHDTIGQTLAFSKMKIRLLQRSPEQDDRAAAIEEIRELIEQSIADTRSLTYELSPPVLYELSFVAALEWLTAQLSQQHNIRIDLEDDKQPKQFGDELRVFVFHAIREILINAVKHANAKRVSICLMRKEENAHIVIQDDGVGFSVPVHDVPVTASGGFGLFNIRERLRHLGGKLDIQSQPGNGTSVTVIVPLLAGQEDSSIKRTLKNV